MYIKIGGIGNIFVYVYSIPSMPMPLICLFPFTVLCCKIFILSQAQSFMRSRFSWFWPDNPMKSLCFKTASSLGLSVDCCERNHDSKLFTLLNASSNAMAVSFGPELAVKNNPNEQKRNTTNFIQKKCEKPPCNSSQIVRVVCMGFPFFFLTEDKKLHTRQLLMM